MKHAPANIILPTIANTGAVLSIALVPSTQSITGSFWLSLAYSFAFLQTAILLILASGRALDPKADNGILFGAAALSATTFAALNAYLWPDHGFLLWGGLAGSGIWVFAIAVAVGAFTVAAQIMDGKKARA